MVMTDREFFNNWLHPSEIARGVPVGWKGDYIVAVYGGKHWIEKLEWLRENTTGHWRDCIRQPNLTIGFEKEIDAVAFKLRW